MHGRKDSIELEGQAAPRDVKAFTPLDQRSGGGRDAVLDGLRTVAVATVILSHGLRYRFDEALGEKVDLLQRAVIPAAHNGISILFIISGYVITRLLWVERTKQGTVHLTAFWGPPVATGHSAVLLFAGCDRLDAWVGVHRHLVSGDRCLRSLPLQHGHRPL